MISFYLKARPHMGGQLVELEVWRGRHEASDNTRLGSVNFTVDEWRAFRPFVIGGLRVAGYARVPIEFMDGLRGKPTGV